MYVHIYVCILICMHVLMFGARHAWVYAYRHMDPTFYKIFAKTQPTALSISYAIVMHGPATNMSLKYHIFPICKLVSVHI